MPSYDAVLFDFGGVFTASPFGAIELAEERHGAAPGQLRAIIFGHEEGDPGPAPAHPGVIGWFAPGPVPALVAEEPAVLLQGNVSRAEQPTFLTRGVVLLPEDLSLADWPSPRRGY